MLYETYFLLALAITCAIEVPILIALIRVVFRNENLGIIRIIGVGILCTSLSLPYLWFVLPPYVDAAYYPLTGEVFVVTIEALVLNRLLGLAPERAAACSLIANAASYGVGLFLL
jgi:hypothetical protein